METAALVARLRELGTDTVDVEVKEAAGGFPRTLAETVSAFANGEGGTILLGLAEHDGFRPVDGFDANAIRDALYDCCAIKVEPPIRDEVVIETFEGGRVVRVDISPLDSYDKPCFVVSRGAYQGSFIRGGDGDRRLTRYEVTQLLSNRRQPEWDREPVLEATTADLDPKVVDGLIARVSARQRRAFEGISRDEALIRLGAATRTDGDVRPTLAGVMCLGRYPQQFFPQLFVSVVALPGLTMAADIEGPRFIDNQPCDGPVPVMIRDAIDVVRRNMRVASVVDGIGRRDRYDYPLDVVRELIANAVMHRDYSPEGRGQQVQVEIYPDRLEVTSPGGLYGGITAEQLGVERVSTSRNRVLARLLEDVPMPETGEMVCENRGSGLATVVVRLRDAGMAPPRFVDQAARLRVEVPQHALLSPTIVSWIGSLKAGALSQPQQLALALMRTNGAVSNEMLRVWGIASQDATAALTDLVGRGLAIRFGGRRYATYELVKTPETDDTDSLFKGLFDQPPPAADLPVAPSGLSPRVASIVQAIRAGHTTSRAIAAALGVSQQAAIRRIREAREAGLIEETALRHSRSQSYRLTGSERVTRHDQGG